MAFQVSPGVNVSEIDLTTIVPAVSTSTGAIAGLFNWGPTKERIMVDTEQVMLQRFGKPTNNNAETFFTAANFLSYGNPLYIVRAAGSDVISAIGNSGIATANSLNTIGNRSDYDLKDGTLSSAIQYIAKYPGSFGNSLRVSVCDTADAFATSTSMAPVSGNTSGLLTITVGSNSGVVIVSNTATGNLIEANTAAVNYSQSIAINDLILVGNASVGTQYLKVTSVSSLSSNSTTRSFSVNFDTPLQLHTSISQNTLDRYWEFYNVVDTAPGTSDYVARFGNTSAKDEVHLVVVDQGGKFTGTPGTILEVYKGLSRASDAKTLDGTANYYKQVINDRSQYIWWINDRTSAVSNTAATVTSASNTAVLNLQFNGGAEESTEANASIATLATAYDYFASAEDVDVSLLLQGKARGGTVGEQLGNYLIDNIALKRKDCVVFISPDRADVVDNIGSEVTAVIQFRNYCRDTSYGVLDSGYKYMYDRYNDVYRWVPLNGDIAGLCARTDLTNDPWWSPAGFNRGQVKNIVKLAYNPRKGDRDELYKNGINPVVTFPGQGTVLYGDKTMQSKPSAFDRINVRRLFIVLEKAISTASKFTLFEFNDSFTRAQFKNLVTPFLRDVKGRRGITDFKVVCDESNNPGSVIDRNEFVGDIYVKPARAINFIQLNFVAVASGIQFSEIVGKF